MTTTNRSPDVAPLTTADQLMTGGRSDRSRCYVLNPGIPLPHREEDMCQNVASHYVAVAYASTDEYMGTVYTHVCTPHVEQALRLPGFQSALRSTASLKARA